MVRSEENSSAKKRTPEDIEQDKMFCSPLFTKRIGYREIASRLNEHNKLIGKDYQISHVQVYQDMKSLLIEWKKESWDDINLYMQCELNSLDRMEAELWEQWERSKQKSIRKKIKGEKADKNGDISFDSITDIELTEEEGEGDPRYFDLILKVQLRRATLLGYKDGNLNKQNEGGSEKEFDPGDLPKDKLLDIAKEMFRNTSKRTNDEMRRG